MIHSRRALEGYLVIDHRQSPGVTAGDVVAAGLDPRTVPLVHSGTLHEAPTFTCAHCQAVVIMNPLRTRERHNCVYCDHYICDNPTCRLMAAGLLTHRPLSQLFDELEHAAAGVGISEL